MTVSAASIVEWLFKFIPLLPFNANVELANKVPPFKIKWPAVGEPGTVPSLSSLSILKDPELIVVIPE